MYVCRAETLQSLVAHVVAVKDMRLIRDKFTGQPRGFGFMEFDSVQDAARALQLLQVRCPYVTSCPPPSRPSRRVKKLAQSCCR